MTDSLWVQIQTFLSENEICSKNKADSIEVPQHNSQIMPILRKEFNESVIESVVRKFCTSLSILTNDKAETLEGDLYKGTQGEDVFFIYQGYAFISNPFDGELQKKINREAKKYFLGKFGYCSQDIKSTQIWARAKLLTPTEKHKTDIDGDTQAKRVINDILRRAKQANASDIHIEPRSGDKVVVRIRTSRSLVSLLTYPLAIHESVENKLFDMTEVRLQRLRPQDASFEFRIDNTTYYYRLGRVPVRLKNMPSGKIAIRQFDSDVKLQRLNSLGLNHTHRKQLEKASSRASGIVVVSGPTGSGKSTTLWAGLRHCMELHPDKSFYSVEDPVEQQAEAVTQISIDNNNITFESALKSLMRMDPDVILLGEIRDRETAKTAVGASMTGHLVLTTLHVNNSHKTIERLSDLGVEPSVIADSALLFSAQRLVKKLCDHCKQPISLDEIEDGHKYISFLQRDGKTNTTVYRENGCKKCNGTGYLGLIQIMEILDVNSDVEDAIISGIPMSQFRRNSIREGQFIDMWQDGLEKVSRGLTTISQLNSELKSIENDHPYLVSNKIAKFNSFSKIKS